MIKEGKHLIFHIIPMNLKNFLATLMRYQLA